MGRGGASYWRQMAPAVGVATRSIAPKLERLPVIKRTRFRSRVFDRLHANLQKYKN